MRRGTTAIAQYHNPLPQDETPLYYSLWGTGPTWPLWGTGDSSPLLGGGDHVIARGRGFGAGDEGQARGGGEIVEDLLGEDGASRVGEEGGLMLASTA